MFTQPERFQIALQALRRLKPELELRRYNQRLPFARNAPSDNTGTEKPPIN
jgi:hypothetical protein